jgi:hypothetical protein
MTPTAITANGLRGNVDYWVIGERGRNSQIVHVPAPESTPDAPQPICENREFSPGRRHNWEGWTTKSPAVYPPGYVSLCKICAGIVDDDDRVEIRHLHPDNGV